MHTKGLAGCGQRAGMAGEVMGTVIIRILRMIQFNVRNSILVINHESNST